jgi:hypothetical protein
VVERTGIQLELVQVPADRGLAPEGDSARSGGGAYISQAWCEFFQCSVHPRWSDTGGVPWGQWRRLTPRRCPRVNGLVRRSAPLAKRDSVVLEAGTHEQSVRLKAADLVRLTRAQAADICREEPEAG